MNGFCIPPVPSEQLSNPETETPKHHPTAPPKHRSTETPSHRPCAMPLRWSLADQEKTAKTPEQKERCATLWQRRFRP